MEDDTGKLNQDLLDNYKIMKDIEDRYNVSKELFNDATRNLHELRKKDSMDSMMQTASFLQNSLYKLNIPVLNIRYENMDVRAWSKNHNTVEKGQAKFAIDIIDQEGNKKTFTVPVEIRKGEMQEPEYFLDSVGRKYAYTTDGINDYVTSEEATQDDDSITKKDETVNRSPGEEMMLAKEDKDMKKEAFQETCECGTVLDEGESYCRECGRGDRRDGGSGESEYYDPGFKEWKSKFNFIIGRHYPELSVPTEDTLYYYFISDVDPSDAAKEIIDLVAANSNKNMEKKAEEKESE
jgi:hypothetical protein